MALEGFENLSLDEKRVHIEKLIDEQVKPALAADGGSLEVQGVTEEEGEVRVSILYLGACQGCVHSLTMTLQGIQQFLADALHESIRVIPVQ